MHDRSSSDIHMHTFIYSNGTRAEFQHGKYICLEMPEMARMVLQAEN